MKFSGIVGLAVGLAVMAGPVAAFQEQQVGGNAPASTPAPGIVIDNSRTVADPAVEFNAPQSSKAAKSGPEVFIPGLGSLGVLPTMDFGLELLYGASETVRPVQPSDVPNASGDDIILRGTVKHRF